MKRKIIAATAAAVVAIGGGAWAGLGSATATTARPSIHGWPHSGSVSSTISSARASAAAGSRVLLLRAHQVSETDIDVGDPGFGPGDYFLFEEDLRYQHGSQIIGHDSVRCTAGATTFLCDATAQIFGKGKITVYAALFGPRDNRLAVTGGTGLYRGVGGQLLTVNLHHGNELLAFELTR